MPIDPTGGTSAAGQIAPGAGVPTDALSRVPVRAQPGTPATFALFGITPGNPPNVHMTETPMRAGETAADLRRNIAHLNTMIPALGRENSQWRMAVPGQHANWGQALSGDRAVEAATAMRDAMQTRLNELTAGGRRGDATERVRGSGPLSQTAHLTLPPKTTA